MVKIAGLWKKQGANGEFLVGPLSQTTSIMIFPNKNKNSANQPDFEVVIAENKPKAQAPKTPPQAPPRDDNGFGF